MQLMKRLGFQQFYAHGGDWGWLVTTNMAQLEPKTVKGLHVNFAPPSKPGLLMTLSIMLGRRFPKLFGFTETDVERLYPCMEKLVLESIKESGYMHIQATKPDTAGRGLNDSPVGLAAYILEKFSTWTDHDFRNLEDGGLTRLGIGAKGRHFSNVKKDFDWRRQVDKLNQYPHFKTNIEDNFDLFELLTRH
uniref:Epoxide hydrolase 1, microsomal (xenobiotic) n=1 Tax=Poecilia reticulata TaxID=8081 RepID=A0A3P9Q7A0_POERE